MSETAEAGLRLRVAMAANRAARRLLYESPLCARVLFGTWFEPCDGISFFELPTLAMRQVLAHDLRRGMRVLEIGTGPYAVLALWAANRFGIDVIATEIEPSWAERARALSTRNGVSLSVHTGDIVADLEGVFDAIWFVPPFISRARFDEIVRRQWTGSARELELLALRSVGGDDGSELIARFYAEAAARLSSHGRAYIAYNARHVDEETIKSHARAAGLQVLARRRLVGLPFRVQVTQKYA